MCDFQSEVERLYDNPRKLQSFIKRYIKFDVLAIDDLGLNSEVLPPKILSTLFNIIDARVPYKPIVITTQMKPDGLLRVFGGGAQAEAILDRLLHHCKVMTIKGESYRILSVKKRSTVTRKHKIGIINLWSTFLSRNNQDELTNRTIFI